MLAGNGPHLRQVIDAKVDEFRRGVPAVEDVSCCYDWHVPGRDQVGELLQISPLDFKPIIFRPAGGLLEGEMEVAA